MDKRNNNTVYRMHWTQTTLWFELHFKSCFWKKKKEQDNNNKKEHQKILNQTDRTQKKKAILSEVTETHEDKHGIYLHIGWY